MPRSTYTYVVSQFAFLKVSLQFSGFRPDEKKRIWWSSPGNVFAEGWRASSFPPPQKTGFLSSWKPEVANCIRPCTRTCTLWSACRLTENCFQPNQFDFSTHKLRLSEWRLSLPKQLHRIKLPEQIWIWVSSWQSPWLFYCSFNNWSPKGSVERVWSPYIPYNTNCTGAHNPPSRTMLMYICWRAATEFRSRVLTIYFTANPSGSEHSSLVSKDSTPTHIRRPMFLRSGVLVKTTRENDLFNISSRISRGKVSAKK